MNYWIVKTEPESYSWSDLVKDGKTSWTGVRNYQARIHLNSMQKEDVVFFYHSVSEKQIVGLAKVVKTAYPDSTADEPGWVAVDLAPVKPVKRPVTLEEIKSDAALTEIVLARNPRLSVSPLTAAQAKRVLQLSQTN